MFILEYLSFFNIISTIILILAIANFVPIFLIKGFFLGLIISFVFALMSILFIGYDTIKQILEEIPNWLSYILIFSLVSLFWLKFSIDFYWNFDIGENKL